MKVKVACLFVFGGCWHEWDWKPIDNNPYDYACLKCGLRADSVQHPDPLHNKGDYWSLVEGMMLRHEAWKKFSTYAYSMWIKDRHTTYNQEQWLFLDPARFIDLIWEWTGLEEVQEKWGWVKCNHCVAGVEESNAVFIKECSICNGSGHLPAPWLVERRNSCQG